MIRLIIVEDEKMIRNGIEKHVPWKTIGVDEICTAANAKEALAVCDSFLPDIILSDIRMPGMDGIELCKTFREKLPGAQIIFISGFSDKEYLMAAISLGAVSYVEKPLSVDRISAAVTKAVESVERYRSQQQNVIHSLMRPAEEHTEKKIMSGSLDQIKDRHKDTFFFMIRIKMQKPVSDTESFLEKLHFYMERQRQEKKLHFLEDFVGRDTQLILVSGKEPDVSRQEAYAPWILEELLSLKEEDENWFLAAGSLVDSFELLQQSCDTSEEAEKCLSYKGFNSWVFHGEYCSEYMTPLSEKEKNTFYCLLTERKCRESLAFLDQIYYFLLEKHAVLNFNVRNIYYTLNALVARAEQTIPLMQLVGAKEEDGHRFLDQAQTIGEMHQYVMRHVRLILEEGDEEQKSSSTVCGVMEYVWKNLECSDLSIQTLADIVYLSPTYLSSLFKKKTGTTINAYITKMRIKKAEELLLNPQYKLYHIAGMVGYEDPNYFARIFKKQTGLLPSEYREKKLI